MIGCMHVLCNCYVIDQWTGTIGQAQVEYIIAYMYSLFLMCVFDLG